ncbi:MAG TPA: NAD(P)/FAD-dependent oxidoreductase, partial [Solirubrobacteraceae bacterium]|nr:NAD(P)/FAD-dependent oxidoreductase [Solirubrobacteraceae bacterium]
AQQGARVALVERRPDIDAYKTVCTHYIQPSATPTIEKLGLAPLIEEHGAVRNSIDLWTPYGGWIRHRGDTPYGYNVTREVLDPLLRRMTAETPGVELLSGHTATELLANGQPGVVVEDRQRARTALRARLVVAADGRDSHVARMAGVRGRVRPHNRFFYWAYWRGVEPADDRSRMWFMEPDCAYTFPNEDGLCLALAAPHRERLPEFRSDLEGAYLRYLAALPDAPDFSQATRESKLLGKLDLPNVSRPAAQPGLAFVGDAALASDPLWGVGCGWAFQSADWLAQETAAALVGGGDLDAALESYRRVHRRRLGLHHFVISDIATARPANPVERAMYRGAVTDDDVYRTFEAIGARRQSPATLFAPRTLARLAHPA